MSYRDVRNLLESLRILGFPRHVSMENFREPNFPLVAEILRELTFRYDPKVDFPTEIGAEEDRVIFIKAVGQFMATKANLRLNTKKLYRADGHSVKELLKFANLLIMAIKTNANQTEDDDGPPIDIGQFDLSSKISQLKVTRSLASEITARGASLSDLLGLEVDLRASRKDAVAQSLELDQIEVGVQRGIDMIKEEVARVNSLMNNLGADEANLTGKIEKKQSDLERMSKRLRNLESVRPAYMDEYEKLELELQSHYTDYIEKFRNLTYLENMLERLDRVQREKMEQSEQSLKRMHERLINEELRQGRDETHQSEDMFNNVDTDSSPSDDDEFMPHDDDDDHVAYRGNIGGDGGLDGNLTDSEEDTDDDDDDDDDEGDDFLRDGASISGDDDDSVSDDF